MMALTRDSVQELFENLASGNGDRFFERVSDDVDWTVMGTHPVAGRYRSKAEITDDAFARLDRIFPGGARLVTEYLYVDGETAIVELKAIATDLRGKSFDNRYCWVCRFSGDTIVEVRAYLDSAMVASFVDANETLL